MSHLELALRRLARKPSFAALAILTLALGLGANAAIFAIVDAVLLRPPGYPDPGRLVVIEHSAPGLGLDRMQMSERLYVHYREHASSFVDIGLVDEGPAAVSGLDRPMEVPAAEVTPSVFAVLGIEPVRGRTFLEEEGAPGGAPAVIVSELFWKEQLGADPAILDRVLKVDGVERRIVGVMGAAFAFPDPETRLWIPDVVDPATAPLGSFGRTGIARLAPGADSETARADLRRFTGSLEAVFAGEEAAPVLAEAGFDVGVHGLHESEVGELRPVLWLLLGSAGFLLLLAFVNVANLLLARAEEQGRERAIRTALGAGPGVLFRSSLAEGLVVTGLAGAVGLLLARLGLALLLPRLPRNLPRSHEIAIDVRTATMVVALAVLCGVAFGLVPALRSRATDLSLQLKDGGRSVSGGRGRQRARKALVAVQVAIALVLVVGSGLIARSLLELSRVEPGFDDRSALSFRLSLPESRSEGPDDTVRFYSRVLARLEALPGVRSATAATSVPLAGFVNRSGYRLLDRFEAGANQMPYVFGFSRVAPGFFDTLGIPVLRGRGLEQADLDERRPVVVVSRALAAEYWPGEDPIGKRVFPGTPEEGQEWFEVVGVVGDVRFERLIREPEPVVYSAWLGPLDDAEDAGPGPLDQAVVLRTEGDPRRLVESVQAAIWEIDPEIPLTRIRTLRQLVADGRAELAILTVLLVLAATVSVLLAAVGTYGVISELVAQRRTEIGVRMALGARRRDVEQLVLREGATLAVAGGAVGLAVAAGLVRVLRSILFRVEPLDPVVFALAALVLLAVALAACAIPARRAAAVPPAAALREE